MDGAAVHSAHFGLEPAAMMALMALPVWRLQQTRSRGQARRIPTKYQAPVFVSRRGGQQVSRSAWTGVRNGVHYPALAVHPRIIESARENPPPLGDAGEPAAQIAFRVNGGPKKPATAGSLRHRWVSMSGAASIQAPAATADGRPSGRQMEGPPDECYRARWHATRHRWPCWRKTHRPQARPIRGLPRSGPPESCLLVGLL